MNSKWKLVPWILASLPLVWTLLLILVHGLGPSEAQREALALLSSQRLIVRNNAFPALWLLQFDVPEHELEPTTARDVAAFNALPLDRREGFVSSAGTRFPESPALLRRLAICEGATGECLAWVRAKRSEAHAAVERAKPALERLAGLHQYDGLASDFEAGVYTPVASPGPVESLLLADIALQFDLGNHQLAVDRLCRHELDLRRLGGNNDELIFQLLMARLFDKSARLLSEFLAELPNDSKLPESCNAVALAPVRADVDMCAQMHTEWHMTNSAMQSLFTNSDFAEEPRKQVLLRIFRFYSFDAEATSRRVALRFGAFCLDDVAKELLADRQLVFAQMKPCGLFERSTNHFGCSPLDMVEPESYAKYQDRLLDHAARIRVLGALIWWRQQNRIEETPAERLRRLPGVYQSDARPLELMVGGSSLGIRNFNKRYGDFWSVPLPGSRVPRNERR